jgi:hypothetical protein
MLTMICGLVRQHAKMRDNRDQPKRVAAVFVWVGMCPLLSMGGFGVHVCVRVCVCRSKGLFGFCSLAWSTKADGNCLQRACLFKSHGQWRCQRGTETS